MRGFGRELGLVAFEQSIVFGAVLVWEDGIGGGEAVRFCVVTGCGLALRSARAGAQFTVFTIRECLSGSGHMDHLLSTPC